LWDFSWYTQAGPGQPYADLDEALNQTLARGFTTLRICAAPLLLYGELGLDRVADALEIAGLGARKSGGYFGQGTRWYNTPGGFTLNLRDRFFTLLELARDKGITVALSSWEYQQSTAFAQEDTWYRGISTIPIDSRLQVLGHAWDRLLRAVHEAGLDDAIEFIEIHNEVDFSPVGAWPKAGPPVLESLRQTHPNHRFTASFGKVWAHLWEVEPAMDCGQFHVYAYGVLDAIQQATDIRGHACADFPNPLLRSLQCPGAPTFEEYGRPEPWKLEATVVTDQMLYGYDTVDPQAWDAWLDAHLDEYHNSMTTAVETRVCQAASWGKQHNVPVAIGEGWIGYTPLHGGFEDGDFGRFLVERGVDVARAAGIWAVTPSSNAAPHHPLWSNVAWLESVNHSFLQE
jgi:hypothetical protein